MLKGSLHFQSKTCNKRKYFWLAATLTQQSSKFTNKSSEDNERFKIQWGIKGSFTYKTFLLPFAYTISKCTFYVYLYLLISLFYSINVNCLVMRENLWLNELTSSYWISQIIQKILLPNMIIEKFKCKVLKICKLIWKET